MAGLPMTGAALPAGQQDDESGRLAVFRLVPTERREDRRFARHAFHGEVVVRARSPADARDVAAEAEAAALSDASPERSPFADAALYAVVAVPGADFLRRGERGVVAGRFTPSRNGDGD